ncbi:MAG: S41 family peptidase [bacterium]|nr:S41 family peptidase [bacterium]
MTRRKLVLLLVAALVLSNLTTFALAAGYVPILGIRWGLGLGLRNQLPPYFDRLLRAYAIIESGFVDPEQVQPDRLIEGAISGMVRTLDDPYSYYLDPASYRDFVTHSVEGEYQGIGVVVEYRDPHTTVVHPFRDSPAEEAGMWPRDRIVKVDGRDVVGVPLDIVVDLIRGPAGTPVTLTVERSTAEGDRTLEFTINRARIPLNPSRATILDATLGIGYLHLTGFDQRTPAVVRQALASLRSQGLQALVLDLRHNSGGLLEECAEVAREFVPRGKIVEVVYRDGRREVYESRSEGLGLPLVVLVDGGTASAAEILAGAIRDREAGTVVGTRTFGKGSVQSLPSVGGGAALRITTARYYLPGGDTPDQTGLEPDVWVDNEEPREGEPPIRLEAAEDPRNRQLIEAMAILRQELGR